MFPACTHTILHPDVFISLLFYLKSSLWPSFKRAFFFFAKNYLKSTPCYSEGPERVGKYVNDFSSVVGTWRGALFALFGDAKKAEFRFIFFSWQHSLWESDCLWTPCLGSTELAWEHVHAQAISKALCKQQGLWLLVLSLSQGQIKCEGASAPSPCHLSLTPHWLLWFSQRLFLLFVKVIDRFKGGLKSWLIILSLVYQFTTEKYILHFSM